MGASWLPCAGRKINAGQGPACWGDAYFTTGAEMKVICCEQLAAAKRVALRDVRMRRREAPSARGGKKSVLYASCCAPQLIFPILKFIFTIVFIYGNIMMDLFD